MSSPATLVALLHGPDQPGLVARVSGWIFARGGNILHADQHHDREAGIFFQRVEWTPTGAEGGAERDALDLEAFFQAAEAHRALEGRATTRKVLLVP